MKTNKLTDTNSSGYFDALPESWQTAVKDAILEIASQRRGPDCWKSDEECIEEIECRSRDGFIAFSHNKGGFRYQNFTDLMSYWGGGYNCTHKEANAEIERQIEYNFKLLKESCLNKFKEQLTERGLDDSACEYHEAQELEEKNTKDEFYTELRRWIENAESEYLGNNDRSIMHEFRFMYHGVNEDGEHEASVSAAINTEGPYHRSHISWAPNVFCEGSKEIEITFKNLTELKKKLKSTFKKVSAEVF